MRERANTSGREAELTVAGVAAVRASLRARPEDARRLFLSDARAPEFGDVMRGFAEARLPYRILPPDELARVAGTERHEGVVLVTRALPETSLDAVLDAGAATLLVTPGLENPHNLGALLRVAAHFGVAGLVLEASDPSLSAAACRVAEGGAEAVPIVRVRTVGPALVALARAGYTVLTTTSHEASVDLDGVRLAGKVAWVLGSESRGLPDELLRPPHRSVRIPGSGAVESLNVATAAAVLLAESARQRRRG